MWEFSFFFLGLLAVWRLTECLVFGDGPFCLMLRFRRAAGRGSLGRLLNSYPCLSMWVAALVAAWIAGDSPQWGVVWLALSGGACLLHRLVRRVRT